jgi:putative endonuclease
MNVIQHPDHCGRVNESLAADVRWHITLGKYGESLVCKSLRGQGWQIVARNWRAGRYAELDIVARDPQGQLVFIEVKTRRRRSREDSSCTGFQSIHWRKRLKIVTSARVFMAQYCQNDAAGRFDVVVVQLPLDTAGGQNSLSGPVLTHIIDAFST